MTLPSPFVTGTNTAGFVPAGSLQKELTDRLGRSKFKDAFLHMGIALADLTTIGEDPDPKGPFSVPFAANAKLETEIAVGSLSKIAAMYAGFRLRERVTVAAAAVGTNAKNVDDVVAQITADWQPIVSKKIKKPPEDFPNLKNVFDFAAAAIEVREEGPIRRVIFVVKQFSEKRRHYPSVGLGISKLS